MDRAREIKSVWRSAPTIEGAGVRLKRAFGYYEAPRLDPFLLLDDFHSDEPSDYLPGFPWHPHRGIETITYVLDGRVEHGDSMGNSGVISPGDVQWMTAGSGIIHQEMPKGGPGNRLRGCQLWANLPASHKMMEPRYRGVAGAEMPLVKLSSGATVKVVCGSIEGVAGPVKDIVTDPVYLDVSVPAGSDFDFPVKTGYTAFAYVLEGKGYFDKRRDPYAFEVVSSNYFDFKRECLIGPEHMVLYGKEGGRVEVRAGEAELRFLFFSGKPLDEPVAWYGPIVMNTREELKTAFEEFRNGTFIKHGRKRPGGK